MVLGSEAFCDTLVVVLLSALWLLWKERGRLQGELKAVKARTVHPENRVDSPSPRKRVPTEDSSVVRQRPEPLSREKINQSEESSPESPFESRINAEEVALHRVPGPGVAVFLKKGDDAVQHVDLMDPDQRRELQEYVGRNVTHVNGFTTDELQYATPNDVMVGRRLSTVVVRFELPKSSDKVFEERFRQMCAEEQGISNIVPVTPALSDRQGVRQRDVYRVVVTGGPCGGKSTGMATMKQQLEKGGFSVFIVPEAATLLIDGGSCVLFQDYNDEKLFRFQLQLLRTQLHLEDTFAAIAASAGKRAVVLCDRGTMDGRAFCTPEVWQRILDEERATTPELRDLRYDLVLHLVTAADGAEEFYTTANNSARTEPPEDARAQDKRLQESWLGHPRHRIIGNDAESFDEKLERAIKPILELVGMTKPGVVHKYELHKPPLRSHIPVPTMYSTVTIHVLRGSSSDCIYRLYHRVDADGQSTATHQTLKRMFRRRSSGGLLDTSTRWCGGDSTKSNSTPMSYIRRTEEPLSLNTYNSLLAQCDPTYEIVQKTVISFVTDNCRFELVRYVQPDALSEKCHLFVESDKGKRFGVPDFLRKCGVEDISSQEDDELTSSLIPISRTRCSSAVSEDNINVGTSKTVDTEDRLDLTHTPSFKCAAFSTLQRMAPRRDSVATNATDSSHDIAHHLKSPVLADLFPLQNEEAERVEPLTLGD